jgi:hypothetical protein
MISTRAVPRLSKIVGVFGAEEHKLEAESIKKSADQLNIF